MKHQTNFPDLDPLIQTEHDSLLMEMGRLADHGSDQEFNEAIARFEEFCKRHGIPYDVKSW